MFCPNCKDEFRPGFTRCAGCDVDLVNDLSSVRGAAGQVAVAPPFPTKLVEYCGYFSLDEARDARDRLRVRRIRSEIVLREPPDASWDEPAAEEYWLRVDAGRTREVSAILGAIPEEDAAGADEAEDELGFACGACKQALGGDEVFCPKCGTRFGA